MQKTVKTMDWNLLRAFHMTATTGSLSAAARKLGLTQPTLSRQVTSLEENIGVILFERRGKKLVLTRHGRELLDYVSAMHEAAENVMLSARGQMEDVGGQVCISATDSFSTYVLPEIVEIIRQEAPQISVMVHADNQQAKLQQMEADIAIRHGAPDEPELVGEFIRETEAFFYAAEKWVKRFGLPSKPKDLAGKHMIGFSDTALLTLYLREFGIPAAVEEFKLISNSATVVWEMVKNGLGVAAMTTEVAQRTSGLVRLFPDTKPVSVPIWLVSHRALQSSPRVRIVRDILLRELSAAAKIELT